VGLVIGLFFAQLTWGRAGPGLNSLRLLQVRSER
jgi:hypothetical protein